MLERYRPDEHTLVLGLVFTCEPIETSYRITPQFNHVQFGRKAAKMKTNVRSKEMRDAGLDNDSKGKVD